MLKRNEILALIIDWGYRPTTSRSGCSARGRRCPRVPRRSPRRPALDRPRRDPALRGRPPFQVTYGDPITVASTDAAEIQRATQAIADALAATIAAAPEQWYSFKPMWPSTAEEKAALEARRGRDARARPGRGAEAGAGAGGRPGPSASLRGRPAGPAPRLRGLVAASWLACRLPEPPAPRPRGPRRRPGTVSPPSGAASAPEPAPDRAVARASDGPGRGEARGPRPRRIPEALTRLVRDAFRHSARYYVQLARAPIVDQAYLERWLHVETPTRSTRSTAPGGKLFVGMHLGWFELPA